jgi:tetratricopeptide (TPR) repeat protein
VLPYLERALTLAEALDQPETIAEAMNSKAGFLLVHGHRPRESTVLLEGARGIALEHDLHWAALRAYNNLNADLWVMGKFRAAIANAEQALELARRVGDRQWEASFLAGPAGLWMMLGSWDEALALAAEAEALPPNEFVRGLVLQIVPIHLHRGELERARSMLAENESAASSENASWAAVYRLGEAQLHAAEGRRDEAAAAIERALALRMTAAGSQGLIRFVALDVMGDLAGEEKLRELLDIVDELNPGEQGSFMRAQKARFRARLPENETEAELAAAERLFADAEMPFYVAITRLERAENLLAHDRAEEAGALLDQARETFEELRARPWLERLENAAAGSKVPA